MRSATLFAEKLKNKRVVPAETERATERIVFFSPCDFVCLNASRGNNFGRPWSAFSLGAEDGLEGHLRPGLRSVFGRVGIKTWTKRVTRRRVRPR